MQSWRYQGLSFSAVAGSLTIASTRARISVIFSSSLPSKAFRIAAMSSMLPLSPRSFTMRSRTRVAMSVQPSCTRSSSAKPPVWSVAKFMSHFACQPGSRLSNQAGSIGWLLRTSIDEGVRWNTKSSLASRPSGGMHCTAVAPVPMMPMRLSASFVMGAPFGAPPVQA